MAVSGCRVVIINKAPVSEKSFSEVDQIPVLNKSCCYLWKISALNTFMKLTNRDALCELATVNGARTILGTAGLMASH